MVEIFENILWLIQNVTICDSFDTFRPYSDILRATEVLPHLDLPSPIKCPPPWVNIDLHVSAAPLPSH